MWPLGAALAAWMVSAYAVVPWMIRRASDGRGPALLQRLMSGRDTTPVETYLEAWYGLTTRIGLAGMALVVFVVIGLVRRPFVGLAKRAPVGGIALAATASVSALWCVTALFYPFGWDQGILAAVGDSIVRGGMPYRDGWDMKGPLAYYGYASAQWIFGRTLWGIRVLDVGLIIAASTVLARGVGRMTSSRAGTWAMFAFLLWCASLGYFFTAQPDLWVSCLMVLAFAPLLPAVEPRRKRLVAAGVLVGLATLVKPFYAVMLLVPMTATWQAQRYRLTRATVWGWIDVWAAWAMPVVLMLAWFAARGALPDLLEVHLGYTAGGYSALDTAAWSDRVSNTLAFFWKLPLAAAIPLVVYGVSAMWSEHPQHARLLLVWAACAVFGTALQGKFFVYHWTPLYPPLVMLAAYGTWHAVSQSGSVGAQRLAVAAAAVAMGSVAISPASDVGDLVAVAAGRTSVQDHYRRFGHENDPFVAGDDLEAARFIREHSDPEDPVVVFGNNATVGFLSGRPNSTRFVFGMPLTRWVAGGQRSAYREEFLADLRRQPPLYIVVGMAHGGTKEAALADFESFAALLDSAYTLQRRIGSLDVYRRRSSTSPSAIRDPSGQATSNSGAPAPQGRPSK
jgi:hypothetical protein